jgi:hypothetical protein
LAVTAAFSLPTAIIAGSSLLMDVFIALGLTAVLMRLDEAHALAWWNTQMVLLAVAIVLLLSLEVLRKFRLPLIVALKRWGAAVIAVAVTWEAVVWAEPGPSSETPHWGPIQWTLTGLVVLYLLSQAARLKEGAMTRLVLLALVFLFVLSPLFGWGAEPGLHYSYDRRSLGTIFAGFAFFCAIGVLGTLVSAHAGSRLGTTLCSLAVAFRVLILYAEITRDLMLSGLGLIGAGVVFCAIAFAWWKFQRAMPSLPPSRPAGSLS